MFYNRTILGAVDDAIEFSKYTNSTVVNFPNASADPGPSSGRYPTDPFLVNGPVVNWSLLHSLYPPGVASKNGGVVVFDSPERRVPYAHQGTIGYSRELMTSLALGVDYVHSANRDMFLARNLNPMLRQNTSRTGPIVRLDAFGVLGETYADRVWVMENTGSNDYDALNLSLEKRYSNKWSGRVSYSLSKSRGTAENQADKNTFQKLTDLNIDATRPQRRPPVRRVNGRAESQNRRANPATLRHERRSVLDSTVTTSTRMVTERPVTGRHLQRTAPDSMQSVTNNGGRNGGRPDTSRWICAGWRRAFVEQAVGLFLISST